MNKCFCLMLLATFLGLQGCVLVAAGAGAATTGVVVNDRRSIQTMSDDQNIEFTANTQTHQNPAYNGSHVVIVAFNHAVLLAGQVENQDLRQQVESLVQALPKVTRVYNELEVGPASSPIGRSKDLWITTKVKSEMLATKGLNSGQIKVVTENGTLYLMGIVTHKQADSASDVARRVDGVQRVVTLFEYTYG